MALNWFLSSAFTQALGHKSGAIEGLGHQESFKGTKKVVAARASTKEGCPGSGSFQMPLHYPRYKKADYEKMEEWKLDLLLQQYGLAFDGTLDDKRAFAMGAFLWPDQLNLSY